jgi:hypothetical protein
MQAKVAGRDETRLMRPAFSQPPLFQRFLKPFSTVIAKARVQHHVGAARNDVNTVNLQHPHALNRRYNVVTPRVATHRLQQPLRCKLQQSRLGWA